MVKISPFNPSTLPAVCGSPNSPTFCDQVNGRNSSPRDNSTTGYPARYCSIGINMNDGNVIGNGIETFSSITPTIPIEGPVEVLVTAFNYYPGDPWVSQLFARLTTSPANNPIDILIPYDNTGNFSKSFMIGSSQNIQFFVRTPDGVAYDQLVFISVEYFCSGSFVFWGSIAALGRSASVLPYGCFNNNFTRVPSASNRFTDAVSDIVPVTGLTIVPGFAELFIVPILLDQVVSPIPYTLTMIIYEPSGIIYTTVPIDLISGSGTVYPNFFNGQQIQFYLYSGSATVPNAYQVSIFSNCDGEFKPFGGIGFIGCLQQ